MPGEDPFVREGWMELQEVLSSRRTIFRFKPEPVPNEVLEKLFSFGVWAPNHHTTEPWRFVVLGKETKETLGKRYGEIQMGKAPEHVDDDNRATLGEKGYSKFMSKPTIVAVSCLQEGDKQAKREDFAATCCAMQNVQLAAWEAGVGMQWSTGPISLEPQTYSLLGIDPERAYIIGFFYMGFPEEIPKVTRKSIGEVMRWTA
jgi:nitroreductase